MPVLITNWKMKKSLLQLNRQIDSYCCAMQIKSGESVVTVNHTPREISRHCYFVLKEEREEGGLSTYRPSFTRSGSLEIPLVWRFQSRRYVTHCKIKKFVQTLYDNRYTSKKTDSSHEEDEEQICFSVEEGNMKVKSMKNNR